MTITGRALTVNDPLLCATLNKCILFPLENSHPWKPLEQVGWQGNQLEKYSSEGHPKFRHEKTASKRFVMNHKVVKILVFHITLFVTAISNNS